MGERRLGADATATGSTVALLSAEGFVLGRYRLRRRLGTGGFGTVWLARDERLERDVALKLLARERIASGRFEREARAAARLNHPGIVTLYEAAVDDEGAYLVSELVRGSTLAQLIGLGSLSDRAVLAVGLALCGALEYAHQQGVVHRDVKPSNVLVPDHPATAAEMAKLTDFGVARIIGGDSLTRTGDILGTTAYMAPEHAEGHEVGPSADLYSLGLVVYEALTGVNPLRLADRRGRSSRLGIHLPPVRRYRRDLPRELASALDLALRPRPRERGSLPELRQALSSSIERVGDLPGVVAPPWPSPITGRRRDAAAPEIPMGFSEPEELWREEIQRPSGDWAEDALRRPSATRPSRPVVGWPARLLGAGTAASVAAWFAAVVLAPPPVLPIVAVIAAGALVAALPRLGWLALAAAAVTLLLLQHSPGAAIGLGLALAITIVLLVRSPARWPLPTLVPVLAAVGLAGGWPALAGRAPTAWQRLVLGAAGWLWLLFAAFLGSGQSYIRLPRGAPGPSLWMPSLYQTVHHVLGLILSSGLIAPAAVWAAGASVLPLVTRSSPSRRPILALGWALSVTALSAAALGLAGAAGIRIWPAVLGVLACTVGAVLGNPPLSGRGRRASSD